MYDDNLQLISHLCSCTSVSYPSVSTVNFRALNTRRFYSF